MKTNTLKILLVDDEEDDYVIFKDIAEQINTFRFELDWVETLEAAIGRLKDCSYDICFIDYRLRMETGLDFLNAMNESELYCPTIMLTGFGDHKVDVKAMQKGALDYLEKGLLTSSILERTIRFALERSKNLSSLRKSENRLRWISAKQLHIQEEERKRLSRDLHDSVGSNLTAIKLGLEKCIRRLDDEPEQAGASLRTLLTLVQDTIRDLRNIYSDIRPTLLDDLGVIKTLNWYCRKLGSLISDIHIDIQTDIEEQDIPQPLKIVIFRLLQESFNNIHRHSRADQVRIRLKKKDDRIDFTIFDNGIGFDVNKAFDGSTGADTGLGLESMKERTEFIGGTFQVISREGQGTTIHASWNPSFFIDQDTATRE